MYIRMYVIVCVGMYIYLHYACIIFFIVGRSIYFTIKVNVTEYECANFGVSDDKYICLYAYMYICMYVCMPLRILVCNYTLYLCV